MKVPAIRPADEPAPPGGALGMFRQAIRERVARGMSREEAGRDVAQKHPDLHRQVLAQANPGKPLPTYIQWKA